MTRRDEREEIERKLRQVEDYRSKRLLRPDEADAQRDMLQKRLLEAVLPDAPAPGLSGRARMAAFGGMLAFVAIVCGVLVFGNAGLRPRTVAMLHVAARQDADRAAHAAARTAEGTAAGTTDSRDPAGASPTAVSASGAPSSAVKAVAADPHAFVSGHLEIAAPLQRRVGADDAVFITLRHPGEYGLPLAALRKSASDLPLDFSLGAAEVVGDAARLTASGAPVVVEVRVSHTGRGLAQPGDLESSAPPVPLGSTGVRVVVGRVREAP